MAGHYVFPGGILDPADWQYSFWQHHVDLDGQNRCNRLGGGSLSAEQIVAYGVAAIREHGSYEIHGEAEILASLDELLGDFVRDHRMKLPGGKAYEPCYRLVR